MKLEINDIKIVEIYKNNKNCSDIARLFNCDPETIRLRLKKYGIETSKKKCGVICVHCSFDARKEGKTRFGKQIYKCLQCKKVFVSDIKEQEATREKSHNIIKKMYLIDNLSTTEIAEKLGVSSTVPQRILKKYGLTRNISYAKEIDSANNLGLTYDEYLERLPAIKKYRKKIAYLTNQQPISELKHYNKRGKCGVNGAYQLDHKFSVLEGFKNGITPKIIADINNLEFIPWEDNLSKSDRCSITIEKLYESISNSDIIVRAK